MKAIVVKSTGSWYELENEQGQLLKARLKGKIRLKGLKSTNPVAVGDTVIYEMEGDEALITEIQERSNYIIRKSINLSKQVQIIAANVDLLFLVVTISKPLTTLGFIDRFLVGAEAYDIDAIIVYNKIDQLTTSDEDKLKEYKGIYDKAGYEQIEVSALQQINLNVLKERMQGKVSIFSGHSGVGKSTLINALDSSLDLRVNKISDYHQSGQHTTTFAEMHHLSFGARIIDTPGIKGFGNVELRQEFIAHYFPEMRKRLNECKYDNCVHVNEPNCAIKEALAAGEIAESRYFNYLSIYEEDKDENYRTKGY